MVVSKKRVRSVCSYCGTGCGIELIVESRNGKSKVVGVSPQKTHPVSAGKLCVKGASVDKIINSSDRLEHPMVRNKKTGKLEKVSWERALDTVAKKLSEIKSTYGSNSLAVIASTKCSNEETYVTQKFARVVLGTNNIDNATRLCHAPTVYGLYEVFGRSAMTNSYADLAKSKYIIIFGENAATTQPIAFQKILECKKKGGRIVVVDVRMTETAEAADEFVQIKPNTDAILVAGMIKTIIDANLHDKKFIEKQTKGYDALVKSLEKFKMADVTKVTGVDEKTIKRIAKEYGKAKSAAIILGMGITQQSNGMETVQALASLALVTGNFGRPGTGINPLRGCDNVQGACDTGCLPNVYPGYASLTEKNIRRFEKFWRAQALPVSKGLSLTEVFEGVPERILGMYIIGQNPLMSLPDTDRLRKNIEGLEFLVVQDIFMTDVAEYADVVLPAACFAEKDGTITNSERRIQLLEKAADPPGKSMEDWWIVCEIAKRMSHNCAKQFEYKSSRDIFDEIRKCMPAYSGATYRKLKSVGGLQWPVSRENPEGTPILYKDGFGLGGPGSTEDRAVFYPIMFVGPRTYDHVFPFILTTHRLLQQYNTGTMSRHVKELQAAQPEPFVQINNKDAAELGVKDGEVVKIVSPFGDIRLKTRVTDKIQSKVLAVPNHYKEACPNRLIPANLDPISKIPALKFCNVRIEKIEKDEKQIE